MKGLISREENGTWTVRTELGRTADGKRRQHKKRGFATKREAQDYLAKLHREIQTGTHIEPNRLTVSEYLRKWLAEYAEGNVSPRTYERYAEIAECHLIPALGALTLTQLQPLHIQSYYTQARRSGRRDGKGGLSAQTVLHHHRLLSAALRQAVRWQLVLRNPCEAVEPPRVEREELAVLDGAGAERLLQEAEGGRLYLPVLLAVTTGMRLGEVLGLRWKDLELDRGLLRVAQALEETKDGLRFKGPKTHRSRRPVQLPEFVVAELVRHKGEQAQQRLLCGPDYQDHGLVCCQPDGQPWKPWVISKAYEHLAARAGCPEIRFHDLRHSQASLLLDAGVPLKTVQERLGHARASTTLDIYGHLLPGAQEEAARVVEERIGQVLRVPRRSGGDSASPGR